MKFEFKLNAQKPGIKEPPQHPNPFELLKTGETQKEIIRGEPIATDVFGRTLYQTPNGQFRAIGDMFNLVANVYQTQNNLVTLAPPPEDDEEDTMPKQKPKRKAGTIIITPEIVIPGPFDFCYVMEDENWNERIFRTELVNKNKLLETKEIFNTPEGYESDYAWTYYKRAFGFYNSTAFIIGYNAESQRKAYVIDFNGNVITCVNTSNYCHYPGVMYSVYENKLYYAIHLPWYPVNVYSINENVETTLIKSFSASTFNENCPVGIWKNFIAWIDGTKLKIYDYINDIQIAEITVETSSDRYFNLVNFTNEVACFLFSYESNNESLLDQHCIILSADGAYQDIVLPGMCAGMDANNEQAVIYYYPALYQSSLAPWSISLNYQMVHLSLSTNQIVAGINYDIYKSTNGEEWAQIGKNITAKVIRSMAELSDGRVLVGTIGGDIYRSDDNTLTSWSYVTTLSPSSDVWQLMVLENETILALTPGVCVHRSTDNGNTWNSSNLWEEIKSGPEKLVNLGGGRIIGLMGAIPYSVDYGATWINLEPPTMVCPYKGDPSYYCNYDRQNCGLYPSMRCLLTPTYNCYVAEELGILCPYDNPRPNYADTYCFKVQESRFSSPKYNTIYQTVGNKQEIYYASRSDSGYKIYKTLNAAIFNPLPGLIPITTGEVTTVYAEDGVILVAQSYVSGQGKIYRSTNNGQSWSINSSISGGYVSKFYKFKNIIVAVVISPYSYYTKQSLIYSEDNGDTWENAKYDLTGKINIYNKTGEVYTLVKEGEYELDDTIFIYPQLEIGGLRYSKIYNNKFYFYGKVYDIANNVMVSESAESTYGNLILGKYMFYSRYIVDKYNYYVKNLETSEEILLKEGWNPAFLPEHLATYYLR